MSTERENLYTNLDNALATKNAADQQAADTARAQADIRAENLRREQEDRDILTSPEVSQVVNDIHGRVRRVHPGAFIAIADPEAETRSIASRPEMKAYIGWSVDVRPQEEAGFIATYWKEISLRVTRYESGRVAGIRVDNLGDEAPIIGLKDTDGLAVALDEAYTRPSVGHTQHFDGVQGHMINRLPYPQK